MARPDTLEYYDACFKTIEPLVAWRPQINQAIYLIQRHESMYRLAERELKNRVPWVFMALLHYRECSCRLTGQILNGEDYRRVTKNVPVGFGPWPSWVSAAVQGMVYWKMDLIKPWTIARMLMEWEDWNGEGYENRGKDSAYLWTGSVRGIGLGKFKADGKYDPLFQDKQVGCAPILHELIKRGIYSAT